MFFDLRKLSTYFYSLGLNEEAKSVQTLMKKAIEPRSRQELELFQNPEYLRKMIDVLQKVGFRPLQENIVELLQAIEYLKEGVNSNNLLLSGLTLISIIPGFENAKQLTQNAKLESDIDASLELAHTVLKSQGTIQATLNRLKQADISETLMKYIPDSKTLIDYVDRIWNEVRNWSFKTVSLSENQGDIEANLESL